jgi:hypothetical protein
LQNNNKEYKHTVDQHRREIQFDVGYQVLTHLKKERFRRRTYNKLNLKKIGPCMILRKFDANAYEIEVLEDVGISPIFNISDMYPFREDDTRRSKYQKEIQWEKQMLVVENP